MNPPVVPSGILLERFTSVKTVPLSRHPWQFEDFPGCQRVAFFAKTDTCIKDSKTVNTTAALQNYDLSELKRSTRAQR